jgi:chromatin remodeling complex protein RSC6
MTADLKGNEKSSRVMMFFNQEFIERKMDFKPKKALIKEEFSDEVRKLFPECSLLENMIKLEEDIDESLYNYILKIQEKLIKPNFKIEAILKTQVLFSMFYSNINEETLEETRSDFTVEDLEKHLSSIKSLQSENDMINIFQENTPSEIYWSLRFQGKIIYNAELDVPENNSFRKFTYFFNKLIFKFESIIGTPPIEDLEWNRNSNDTDGFEIKRPISIGIPKKLKIIYFLNNFSQKYVIVNQDLINLIGVSKETRPRILYYIWQYIKLNSLQDNKIII